MVTNPLPTRIRSIVVATDLSSESDAVMRAAAGLTAAAGAVLHVVHAVERMGRSLAETPMDLASMGRVLRQVEEDVADQLARTVGEPERVASVKLDLDQAPLAITRRAREVEADLVVLGPRGGAGVQGRMVAPTALRVLEHGAAACLLVPGELELPLRRVLLPVSARDIRTGMVPAGAAAVSCLLEGGGRGAADPAEVRVLHVTHSPIEWRLLSGQMETTVRIASDELAGCGAGEARSEVAWSRTPGAEILRLAHARAAELVVLGVRGTGPLMWARLGDVSSAVIAGLDRPVLLLPHRVAARWSAGSGGVLVTPEGLDEDLLAEPGDALGWKGA